MPYCTKCGKIITEEEESKYEEMCEQCFGETFKRDFAVGCGIALIDVPLTVGAIACLIGTVTCAIGLPNWVTEPWHRWFYSILFGVLSIVSIYVWIKIVKYSAKKMRFKKMQELADQDSKDSVNQY